MAKPDHSAIIVGGGPVGLFLAICLLRGGVDCKVVEAATEPVTGSRSLGIHPVCLELLDRLGICQPFLETGVRIGRGVAISEKRMIGVIDFGRGPRPHNYILACPQWATEAILRREVARLAPTALVTGADFLTFREDKNKVTVVYQHLGRIKESTTAYLIGCDGINSKVRREMDLHFCGRHYPDTYMMGDFPDNTDFGSDAVVFLPREGLVESFPLPWGKRRWVVKTPRHILEPDACTLADIVEARTGFALNTRDVLVSSFRTQWRLAERFVNQRVMLAGDAAHVVSPIGGQGMNLGWLGAWRLSAALNAHRKSYDAFPALMAYEKQQGGTARKAARRAELNMRLGRAVGRPWLRDQIVRGMLSPPLRGKTREIFTMRGL